MGSNSIKDKTNAEILAFVGECEEKYKKLLKLAKKLADEMDSLSEQYKEANNEIKKRGIRNDG